MSTFADRRLEEQIARWRAYVSRRKALHGPDVEELEGHLREQLVALTEGGLAGVSFLGRGQAHGQPRRPLARVRSRGLRTAVEAIVITPDAGGFGEHRARGNEPSS